MEDSNIKSVSIVFMQSTLMSWEVVKVFESRKKAQKFCDEQNKINDPVFDDWGYIEGIYHGLWVMKVE